MIDIEELTIDDKEWKVRAKASGAITARALLDAVDDIATEVQNVAQETAPIGLGENPKDSPGTLAREGILRSPGIAEIIPGGGIGDIPGEITSTHAIGGGFSARGGNPANRGQFSKRPVGGRGLLPGTILGGESRGSIITARVFLNPLVRHAKWVHQGTGIYGPYKHPIVPVFAKYLRFRYRGRSWAKESVRGQKAQPFLTEAYIYVNNVYTPAKMEELRAKLAVEL